MGKLDSTVQALKRRLQDGDWTAGALLPPERNLAAELGISRPTLRKAIDVLVSEGRVLRRQGVGVQISPATSGLSRREEPWRIIAFLVPDVVSRFFGEVTASIEYAALQRGYHLLLCSSRRRLDCEEEQLHQLARRQIDGVIIAHDHVREFPKSLGLLRGAGVPFVFMFNVPTEADFDTVVVDNRAGVEQVMRYLISLGHTRIAFVRPLGNDQLHPREIAFREQAAQKGLHFPPEYILPMEALSDDRSPGAILKLLKAPQPPSAIFAGNDRVALIVLKQIAALGLRVPEDISVVGFDNLQFTEHLPVPLTTVDQPKSEMGRRAAEMLFDRIETSLAIPPRHEVFHPRLVVRDSCGIVSQLGVSLGQDSSRPGVAARASR